MTVCRISIPTLQLPQSISPDGFNSSHGRCFSCISRIANNVPLAKNNFGPRIGLTYGLTPKTIVRAGYGIFWIPSDVSFALNPINDMVNTPGTTYTGTVDGTHPYNTISLPFVNGISPPPGRSLGTQGTQEFLTSVVQAITEVDPYHHPKGYDQQWNLSIERQLPAGFLLSAAYVGSKGTHLEQYSVQTDQISDASRSRAASQFATGGRSAVTLLQSVPNPFSCEWNGTRAGAPITTVGQLLRPFPQYTGVELAGQGSFASTYHSLQVTAQRRFAGADSSSWSHTQTQS